MKNLIILICMTMLFIGCKEAAPTNAAGEKISKELMASKLYSYYTADPKSQLEKDNNLIVEYAVDNNLNCEVTPGGVFYVTTQKGTGDNLVTGGDVSAHYKGYLLDGSEFDSSYGRGKPIEFKVGQMIKGWNEWLTMSNPGTKATLLIPSHLGYGPRARGQKIPANSVLGFDVEILTK